jgi:hypothetical protein
MPMLHLMKVEEREELMAPTPALDLDALLKGIPAGAWVAISSDRDHVIGYGPDMRDVLQEARDKGEGDPLILKVPDQNGTLLL